MHRWLCVSVLSLLLAGLTFQTHSLVAQVNASASTSPVQVSFVGCKSDGQTGPLDAPRVANADVRLDARTAARLALYRPENGPAVLGPRGWSCFATYGSGGTTVMLAPTPRSLPDVLNPKSPGVTGFGIQASAISGGTSGRFTVAQLVMRVFPAQRPFAERVMAEGLLSPSDFPAGVFPADHLTYRGDRVVEFETPPRSQGLGTFFQLRPSSHSIRGIATVMPESDFDVRYLAVRLPHNMNDLAEVIIRQFEAQP